MQIIYSTYIERKVTFALIINIEHGELVGTLCKCSNQ